MNINNTQSWWRYGHVWLVISGPLAVVIASLVTAYLAFQAPDPVFDDYYRKGIEINKTLSEQNQTLTPALQARNHAATSNKP
jgi:hypothetical protein